MKNTTEAEFQRFKAEVLRLQPILGLNEWQIYFKHSPLKESYARTYYDLEGMVANMIFSSKLQDDSYAGLQIERIACHELLHLLLAEMVVFGESRKFEQKLFNGAEERIIRKLEKILEDYGTPRRKTAKVQNSRRA